MKKDYNARLYFPFNLEEKYDNENFGSDKPYSRMYYYKLFINYDNILLFIYLFTN